MDRLVDSVGTPWCTARFLIRTYAMRTSTDGRYHGERRAQARGHALSADPTSGAESPAQGFVRWPLQASGEAALRVDLYSAGHGSPLKAATVPHAGATVAVAICAVWADGVGPRH